MRGAETGTNCATFCCRLAEPPLDAQAPTEARRGLRLNTGDPTFPLPVTRDFCRRKRSPILATAAGQPTGTRKEGQGELRHFGPARLSRSVFRLHGDSPEGPFCFRQTVTCRTPTSGVRGRTTVAISRVSASAAPSNCGANVRSSGTLRQCELPRTSATRQAPLPSESGHRWTNHSSGTSLGARREARSRVAGRGARVGKQHSGPDRLGCVVASRSTAE